MTKCLSVVKDSSGVPYFYFFSAIILQSIRLTLTGINIISKTVPMHIKEAVYNEVRHEDACYDAPSNSFHSLAVVWIGLDWPSVLVCLHLICKLSKCRCRGEGGNGGTWLN